MGGGADPHLGWLGSDGAALAEGLKHLSPEVFGAGDGAAGRCLVAGGLGGAVCLGAGDNLATAGFADPHLPMGVSGHGLLGTVAVGAGGSGAAVTTGAGTSHLGPQLPHLLGELAGAHIRVALTGEGRRRGAGRGIGGFTTLGEGFAAGQGQGSTGITLGRSLRGYPPVVALACPAAQASEGGGLACRTLGPSSWGSWRGIGRDGRLGHGFGSGLGQVGLGQISAGAIAGGVSTLTALGEGLPAGEHQITAGIGDWPGRAAPGRRGWHGQAAARCGHRGTHRRRHSCCGLGRRS